MTLKVADFGYAAHGNTDSLKSYRGTFTYMAPEIKEGGRLYDGKRADLFSAGVVLFILVRGIFPFKEARKEEYFYSLLCQGKLAEYWSKVESEYLSSDFKNLIERLLSYDPMQRPTLEEIRAHPWMTAQAPAPGLIKQQLIQQVA
jgi:serine/threonine protein kinase